MGIINLKILLVLAKKKRWYRCHHNFCSLKENEEVFKNKLKDK